MMLNIKLIPCLADITWLTSGIVTFTTRLNVCRQVHSVGDTVFGCLAVDGHHLLHQCFVEEAPATGADAVVQEVIPQPLDDVRRIGQDPHAPETSND